MLCQPCALHVPACALLWPSSFVAGTRKLLEPVGQCVQLARLEKGRPAPACCSRTRLLRDCCVGILTVASARGLQRRSGFGESAGGLTHSALCICAVATEAPCRWTLGPSNFVNELLIPRCVLCRFEPVRGAAATRCTSAKLGGPVQSPTTRFVLRALYQTCQCECVAGFARTPVFTFSGAVSKPLLARERGPARRMQQN